MMSFLKKYQDQLGILVVWLVLILIINPIGDFPLNDDWCYGKSVKTLTEKGYLKLYNWGEMTLVGHVFWGYFFTKIFGFSFTILRFSTLIMGYATLIGTYNLCKLANISRWITLVGVLLCMMNPIFLSLSFSFMTDIPFMCVVIWAFYFFAKALHTNKWQPIVWAIVFCCWAFLIRQLAWVFPIVWLITVLLVKKRNLQNLRKAIVPLVVLFVFSMVFNYIMETNGLLQERYNSKFNLLLHNIVNLNMTILINSVSYFFRVMAYLGLFGLPIHLLYFNRYRFRGDKIIAIIWTAFVTFFLLKTGKELPSLDNIWIDFGVGPTTLHDHLGNFTSSPEPRAPKLFLQIITAIGVLSSTALVFHIRRLAIGFFKKTTLSPLIMFAFVFSVTYLTPFLIVGVYDRYLLPLFPIVIVFLGTNASIKPNKKLQYSTYVCIVLFSLFSICAVHDHLSWNRVRWQVLNELTETIPKNQIQGGVEYVTWNFFSDEQEKWWENVETVYSLVFKPDDNQEIIRKYKYERWLFGDGVLFLIKSK